MNKRKQKACHRKRRASDARWEASSTVCGMQRAAWQDSGNYGLLCMESVLPYLLCYTHTKNTEIEENEKGFYNNKRCRRTLDCIYNTSDNAYNQKNNNERAQYTSKAEREVECLEGGRGGKECEAATFCGMLSTCQELAV